MKKNTLFILALCLTSMAFVWAYQPVLKEIHTKNTSQIAIGSQPNSPSIFTTLLQSNQEISSDPEPENMKGITARHNEYRAKVGAPPLVWSSELAAYAQAWASELKKRDCDLDHRPYSGKWKQQYGENIYWSDGIKNTPATVADDWGSEKYDFNYNTCNYNNFTSNGKIVGHYTQMVWSKTQKIGCAMVRCGDQEIWVCNYSPAGNMMGQKPYEIK